MQEQSGPWRPLECTAQPWRDSIWLQPRGELDFDSVEIVRERLTQHLDAGFSHVVIDLRKVVFVDSAALGLLIQAHYEVVDRGMKFSVVPGPPGVQRLFEITGTAGLFPAPARELGGPCAAET